jgi:hypothetical protein
MSFDPTQPFEVEGSGFDPSASFDVEAPDNRTGPSKRYVNPNRGKSGARLAGEGALKFANDISLGRRQLMAGLAGMFGVEGAEDEQRTLEGIADVRKLDPVMDTTAGQLGYAGAAMVPAVGAAFIPGANTMTGAGLIGAGMGFMQPTGTTDSRFANTVTSSGAAALGQGAFNAIGRIAQPVQKALTPAQSRSVATLEAARVPLDAAQRTGSARLGMVKSALTDNPFTVSGQRTAAQGQKSAFNRAVLEKIGVNADVADEAAMGGAYTRIGKQIDDVLGKYSVAPTPAEIAGSRTIAADAARALGKDNQIARTLSDIQEHMRSNGGKLDGQFYQKIRRELGAAERVADVSPHAAALRNLLDKSFHRTAGPKDSELLTEGYRQWRNMRIIENAVDEAGDISPAKLANQFGQKKNRYAGVYGKGDKSIIELARLAKAGKNVIPEKMPNSGTTPRALMQILAPAAIGGGYGAYKEGNLTGIGAYALGGAALPFAAQRAINSPGLANYLAHGIGQPLVRSALLAPSRAGLGSTVPAYLLTQE